MFAMVAGARLRSADVELNPPMTGNHLVESIGQGRSGCAPASQIQGKQVGMRRSDIRAQTASVRLSRDQNVFWSGLSLFLSRFRPDRLYPLPRSMVARGSSLSVSCTPSSRPSRTQGNAFSETESRGLRYGEIMKEYPHPGPTFDEQEQATKFMAFAGTEGYHPVAYAPYILAAAIGNLLKLDFPNLLLLMRLLGLITFTAVAAYAIKLTPTLKWAFMLIAMLPVSIYNRSVLSADGAALAYALVITALCFSAAQRHGRIWERSLWMTLCALSKQPQIVFVLLELVVGRITELRRRWSSLALVAVPSFILSPLWVLAVSADIAVWRLAQAETYPREYFDPLWKLAYMWEHPLHFPLAAWRSVRPAVARADWHLGVAGCLDSDLDLFHAHGHSSPRPPAKTEFGWGGACTSGSHHGPCCRGLYCDRVSDLLSHLYAGHY